VTDKTNGLGPGTIEIDGETYGTFSWLEGAVKHTVRELSVDEGDDAAEASTDDKGKFNSRLNTRLLLAKSLVEPKVTVDQVGKFGNVKYLTVLRHFNRLNSLPPEVPTPPAGSAGQTSQDGGEPLPTA
jgi:hypothetical protein